MCPTRIKGGSWLLQWRGLPYGEATFEKAVDIEKAGGAEDIKELHVRVYYIPYSLCFYIFSKFTISARHS